MNAADLYTRAIALGLKLEPSGDRLAVTPGRLCPPDFAAELRAHKAELMQWLSSLPVEPAETPPSPEAEVLPHYTAAGDLVVPLASPARFHFWQKRRECDGILTLAEVRQSIKT